MRLNRALLGELRQPVFIFDKDGTLVDTEKLYFEAYDRLLREFGCHHDTATHVQMMGARNKTCFRILRERHPRFPQSDEALPDLDFRLLAHVGVLRRERGTRSMPGAGDFLACCRKHGIRLALATSAIRENAVRDLRNLGWLHLFETIVTADDVKNHKPAPDAYLEAANRMGVPPTDCLVFEDGLRGIQSAHAAGMPVIFVRDPRFGLEPPAEAAYTISNFEELLL